MARAAVAAAAFGVVLLLRQRRRATGTSIEADQDRLGKGKSEGSSEGQAAAAPAAGPEQTLEVVIRYCAKCKWDLRAAWMAQELLKTFQDHLKSVNLAPSFEGGTYLIEVLRAGEGAIVIWDRRVEGRFPDAKEVKKRLRDLALPGLGLGKCLERKAPSPQSPPPSSIAQ